jgi:hypothetical protein
MLVLAQQESAQIAGLLCGLVMALVMGTLIGAIILRAAIWAFNKLAGTDAAVPEPTFGKAMLVAFVTSFVNNIAGIGLGFVLGASLRAAGLEGIQLQAVVQAIAMPFGILVAGGMLSVLLPTTFMRGILVALIMMAIAIALAVFIVLMFVGLGMALGGR